MYRSRIVAKDLEAKRDPSMPALNTFAPMRALEMLKLMLSLAAMWRRSLRGKVSVIMVVGVRHWNADARRTVYIPPPDENWEEGMCGLAAFSMPSRVGTTWSATCSGRTASS